MSIILNKEQLATNNLRRNALDILEAGLQAIDTKEVIRRKVNIKEGILYVDKKEIARLSFPDQGEGHARAKGGVYFVGIGKCALDGAYAMEEILGDYLTDGIVLDVRPVADAEALVNRSKIKYKQGTHPLPSEQNVLATKEILNMVGDLTANDLVITLISGGGSALFELPKSKFSLDDIIEKTKELTARGADIYELNTARKEMSQVKGGKFGKIIAPAKSISLIFSDVLGNDISVIASGPTVIPHPIPSPSQGEGQSTEGAGGEVEKVENILLVSNHDALLAMKTKAESLGFNTKIETEKFSGNASEMGKELALRQIEPKTCLLFGGETTVIVPQNHGIGGRNQEMALSGLLYIRENSILVCAASDGFDNTDHAGAIVDGKLLMKAREVNLSPEEFLMHGDSYNFFKLLGDGAISTGRLGSNVSDLVILIYE